METKRYDVFISYNVRDKLDARELAHELSRLELDVFYDETNLLPGASWREATIDAVERSASVIVLVSPGDDASASQRPEVSTAVRLAASGRQLLIPVFLGNAVPKDLPPGLRKFSGLAAHGDLMVAARSIARAIGTNIEESGALRRIRSPAIPPVPTNFADTGQLDVLLKALTSTTSRAPIWVTGMGGAGKTTLVAAACRSLDSELDICWWVDGSSFEAAVSDLADLYWTMKPAQHEVDRRSAAELAELDLTSTNKRWILVVDDFDQDKRLLDLLPSPGGNGQVIVVSWLVPTREGSPQIVVSALDIQSSVELLEALLPRTTDIQPLARSELAELARVCGGLPLVLTMAASRIAHGHGSQRTILREIVDGAHQPGSEFAQETVRLLLRQLRAGSSLANWIVEVVAWTADSPLPVEVLTDAAFQSAGQPASEVQRELSELAVLAV